MGQNDIIASFKENCGSVCEELKMAFLSVHNRYLLLVCFFTLNNIISCFQNFNAALHGPLNVFQSQKGFLGSVLKSKPTKK